MQMKFTVVKNADVEKYLSKYDQEKFVDCVGQIEMNRAIEGRGNSSYLVISNEEPYADEIIEIMKRHGHWGNGRKAKVVKDFNHKGKGYKKDQEFEIKNIPARLPASEGIFVSGKWFCDVDSPLFEKYFTLLN